MSALRLLVFPAGRNHLAQVWTIRAGSPAGRVRSPCIGIRYSTGWHFAGACRVDRARLARVIHLVPSSRSNVGKAILAGDEHARLNAKRGAR
jgi:hypothetical protein